MDRTGFAVGARGPFADLQRIFVVIETCQSRCFFPTGLDSYDLLEVLSACGSLVNGPVI